MIYSVVLLNHLFSPKESFLMLLLFYTVKLTEISMSQFSSIAVMSNSLRPHGLQHQGFPVHHHFPELAQTHVHQVSDAIQPFHPLPSPSPPALIFPSIRVFSNESVLHIR